MYSVRYKGLQIVVTDSAMRDLIKEDMTLFDVKKILESGYNAPRTRTKDKIEKWLDKGKKTFNVVIVKGHNEIMKEDCWVLIHVGKFTRKKK